MMTDDYMDQSEFTVAGVPSAQLGVRSTATERKGIDASLQTNKEQLPIMGETVKMTAEEALQPHIDHGTTIARNITCMTGILKQLLSAMPETDNLEAARCLLKSISENQEALNGLLRKALARSKMKISGDAVRNFTGGYC